MKAASTLIFAALICPSWQTPVLAADPPASPAPAPEAGAAGKPGAADSKEKDTATDDDSDDKDELPEEPKWPRTFTTDGVHLTIYQPQVDEWKDYRNLQGSAAFVLTAKDGKPVAGVVDVAGTTSTDLDSRAVLIHDIKITAARFPTLPSTEAPPMEQLLRKTFPEKSMTVGLDRLAASVEKTKNPPSLDLKMDPPAIFVSTGPAALLMVEGEPVLAPVTGTNLQFVVNTNWDLFFDKGTSAYYLLAGGAWLSAPKLGNEWTLAGEVPDDFEKLPKGDQWDHVKKALPAKIEKGMEVPQVFFSTKPAELISFNGSPVWEEVEDTHLLWGKNTDNWVFENAENHQIYFLISGRWFKAPKWEGPWTYTGNNLPDDFKQIPPDSPCADVLASVPGTPEAEDAVLMAQVPQEAVINRKEAEAKAKVSYDGEPQFATVEGTSVTYATNTSSDVVRVNNNYYLCQDAVWFTSTAATGPWVTCLEVPAEIYTIPPSCPVYRVTYVRVYPSPSEDVVVCGYTAGYFGAFVAGAAVGACLMWGTGYYYHPWIYAGGVAPIYRPWPMTYGVAAAYNPWTGGYAVGARAYGPYAVAGRAAWHNPVTGNYGRAARIEGPWGSRTIAAGYNPRTDTGWATRQNYNGYAQWGSTAVRHGDDWARAGHISTRDGGVAAWRGSDGGGRVWRTDDHSGGAAFHDGDFYAGHDGNVYRRDDDGNWSKWDDGDWGSVDHKKDNFDNARDRYQNRNSSGGDSPNRIQPGGGGNRPDGGRQPADRTRPGENGGGEQRDLPGNRTRPGADGGGEQKKPDRPDRPRPGEDGGGTQKKPERPDRDNGKPSAGRDRDGDRKPDRDRDPAQRPATRPAKQQPSDDTMKRLQKDSMNRQRSNFHADEQRNAMPRRSSSSSGGGSAERPSFSGAGGSRPSFNRASASSRSFGGGGGHRGGGFRRR